MYQNDLSTFSEGLLRVRARFINELEEKRLRLTQLRSHLQSHEQSHAASREIGQICHKIAGTAATLGFPVLGKYALAIDGAIDQRSTNLPSPSAELRCDIDDLITEIERIQATTA
ncbi:Hpt domain-containing protein [Roseovarius nanhaiticus]|uniref:Hpt domain-containing protein n=1 Tax=Roseovarius nanhaiticus TaxID=573024 RepID=A0A1N7FBF0_9RHOB|nr:Hpt domain-containing protein [Roseovarius nanhaiticus]SEK58141.1 Hpt domain-containing protein [Roseovarius nanhaiticus]SIR97612.1 Hpt domain-containing protein [Roseovarius nanhaiticus]